MMQLILLTMACLGAASATCKPKLRVENFINPGPSLDMVSSLVIGSEAAVIVDLPLAVPQAVALAEWVANTTDKPLVAAFSTHFHPDHYLSGAAFLARFPETKLYANSKAVALIENEVEQKIATWKGILGSNAVVDKPAIPIPYDFTFFTLPGDESDPIHLISPLVADTIDETLFWIPSISTLIAGDAVYSHTVHLWLADLLSPVLTEGWLSTLDFVESLAPKRIIPGHSLTLKGFGPKVDLKYSRDYVKFFKDEIESKGEDFYTPQEIFKLIDKKFPGLLASKTSTTSLTLLNITGEEFGRGGRRQVHYVDLAAFNSTAELEGWNLGLKDE
ncbi:Cytochrome c domain-containing protein [Fusarium keratoplasticum]|nr:Cytochrome c domain-containing protein [Fusarium keratoplasticum]